MELRSSHLGKGWSELMSKCHLFYTLLYKGSEPFGTVLATLYDKHHCVAGINIYANE